MPDSVTDTTVYVMDENPSQGVGSEGPIWGIRRNKVMNKQEK